MSLMKVDYGEVGGGHFEKIWENPNPNNGTSALTVNIDVSKYKYLLFINCYSTSYMNHWGYNLWVRDAVASFSINADEHIRYVIITDSSITYQQTSSSVIPLYIYASNDDLGLPEPTL